MSVNITQGFYILQTPHGKDSREIDKVNISNFNRVFYLQINPQTYQILLDARANAWFREGLIDGKNDIEPRTLMHRERLNEVIDGYAERRNKLFSDDKIYFERNSLVRFVDVELINNELFYRDYDHLLEEIVMEAHGEINL